jgi:hypothetical protein
MRRVGDVWTIDDGRTTLHLNDGRGVRLLALLLERPGAQVHSLELVAIVDGTAPPDGGHGPGAERARVNVTRAIRSTLRRIAGYDARLGRELESCVRTGTCCAYEPDPRRPLRWTVER